MDIVATKGKFSGKSPKDLMKPQDGQDIAEKIKLNDLKISSTIGLIDENNAQIAQVHSITSRDSPVSNISVDFNLHAPFPNDDSILESRTDEECGNSTYKGDATSSCNSNSDHMFSIGKTASPVQPLITDERLNLIWPQPKHVRQLDGDSCQFRKRLTLTVSPGPVSIHE